jgi:hypothetical protein
MTPYDLRLKLVENGYRPLPCIGKKPTLTGWTSERDLSPETIARYSGPDTGVECGLLVGFDVDIDDPEPVATIISSIEDWAGASGKVLKRRGRRPRVLVPFRTTQEFRKLVQWFRAPNGTYQKIEVLAKGQQFLAYGVHEDTGEPYTWDGDADLLTTPLHELPEIAEGSALSLLQYLTDLLKEEYGYESCDGPPKANGGDVHLNGHDSEIRPGNINVGQRDATHDRMRAGESIDTIVLDLLEATQKVAAPGWNWEKEERQIRWMCYRLVNKDPTLAHTLPERLWEAWQAIVTRGGIPRIGIKGRGFRVLGDGSSQQEEAPRGAEPSLPAGWVICDLNNIPPTRWRIKGMLPEVGLVILAGQFAMHKTGVVVDMASAMMQGSMFAGQYKVVTPCAVMLYALEGAQGINARLLAASGYEMGNAPRVPFAQCGECPPLSHPHTAAKMIADIKQINSYMEHFFKLPVGVVFIDTYSLAAGHTGSGDDNDRAATQKAYTTLRRVVNECKLSVVVVDHYGKLVEAGTTGSSAKEGNADTVLANLGERGNSGDLCDTRLVIRKQRDGEAGIEIPFEPEVVTLAHDADGDPITSVRLVWGKPQTIKPKAKPGPNDKLLARALDETLREQGFTFQPDFDTEVSACLESALKDRFHEIFPRGDGTDQQYQTRRSMAFDRAMRKALGNGQLEREDRVDGAVVYRPAKQSVRDE